MHPCRHPLEHKSRLVTATRPLPVSSPRTATTPAVKDDREHYRKTAERQSKRASLRCPETWRCRPAAGHRTTARALIRLTSQPRALDENS
jgi:hypothetical protein